MSLYHDLQDALNGACCQTCGGVGLCCDGATGDLSGNRWTCQTCGGTGLDAGLDFGGLTGIASLFLGLNDRERTILGEMVLDREVNAAALLRQALRIHQLVDAKAKAGLTLRFMHPDGTPEAELPKTAPVETFATIFGLGVFEDHVIDGVTNELIDDGMPA